MSREAIPGLLDRAEELAGAGEGAAAVEAYLRAVEMDPEFMMDSVAWDHIRSAFTGSGGPAWAKDWISVPEELVPGGVVAQLERLPTFRYSGPLAPPTDAELRDLIARLRTILLGFSGVAEPEKVDAMPDRGDVVRFEASCPNCGTPLSDLTMPLELWGMGLRGLGPHVVCSDCHQQIATRIVPDAAGNDHLFVKMLTLPVGVADPGEVEARPVTPA